MDENFFGADCSFYFCFVLHKLSLYRWRRRKRERWLQQINHTQQFLGNVSDGKDNYQGLFKMEEGETIDTICKNSCVKYLYLTRTSDKHLISNLIHYITICDEKFEHGNKKIAKDKNIRYGEKKDFMTIKKKSTVLVVIYNYFTLVQWSRLVLDQFQAVKLYIGLKQELFYKLTLT